MPTRVVDARDEGSSDRGCETEHRSYRGRKEFGHIWLGGTLQGFHQTHTEGKQGLQGRREQFRHLLGGNDGVQSTGCFDQRPGERLADRETHQSSFNRSGDCNKSCPDGDSHRSSMSRARFRCMTKDKRTCLHQKLLFLQVCLLGDQKVVDHLLALFQSTH